MHIHPNNNLALASIGSAREDMLAVQAKRAAEVRKRLSAAALALDVEETHIAEDAARAGAPIHPRGRLEDEEAAYGTILSVRA